MKFAVVGTNFISDKFADAVATLSDAEISAVYSRKCDTGEAFAEKHGINRVYTDYLDLLCDGNVDAVYIASPTMCHAEQSIMAMQCGRSVLCEKMMAASLPEFYAMKECSRATGKVLLEAMRPCFDPATELIRRSFATIGRIKRAKFIFCQYSSRYDAFLGGALPNAFNPKMKNSALSDIGIYPLHMAVNLFGMPNGIFANSAFLQNGFEGEGQILLDYSNMSVEIEYSKIRGTNEPSVILGSDGEITLDRINSPSEIYLTIGKEKQKLPYKAVPNNMIYEISAFSDMVSGKMNYLPYLDITEKTQIIVDMAYRQTGVCKKF